MFSYLSHRSRGRRRGHDELRAFDVTGKNHAVPLSFYLFIRPSGPGMCLCLCLPLSLSFSVSLCLEPVIITIVCQSTTFMCWGCRLVARRRPSARPWHRNKAGHVPTIHGRAPRQGGAAHTMPLTGVLMDRHCAQTGARTWRPTALWSNWQDTNLQIDAKTQCT